MPAQPFVTSDNGYGFLRQANGTYLLVYTGINGHDEFDDVVQAQPAAFNDPTKAILVPDYWSFNEPAWTDDAGATWTDESVAKPAGFGFFDGMAKLGITANVDEDGFIWLAARQTGAPNEVYIFKSTDATGSAWIQKWNATSILGWSFAEASVYITAGKFWWLDGTNNKLKRVDAEDGASYAEFSISIPSYPLTATFTIPDQEIDHPGEGDNTNVTDILMSGGSTEFPVAADGVSYRIPRTGTWNWLVTMDMAWTHGSSTPTCACYHTNQLVSVTVLANPPGYGPSPFDRWIVGDAAYGANIDDFGFGPVTVSVGNFATDESGITLYGNGLTTDNACGISGNPFGTGMALQDGRHTDSFSCGQRGKFVIDQPGSCLEGTKRTSISGISISFEFVQFTTLGNWAMNGWHSSNKLVAWDYLNTKPVLCMDISNPASPTFTWSDEYAPFGDCHGAYDVSPLADGTLIANSLFTQSPKDTDVSGTNPNRYKLGSIWRSVDDGVTWTEVVAETVDLGDDNQNNIISCIAPDPCTSSYVYVAIKPPFLYRSTNSGASFAQETVGYGAAAVDPTEWCGIAALGCAAIPVRRRIAQATLIGAT